ncbi:superoxide dismutase [Kribbella turkmenica]|uniref:Superoxide dismutase n=1 Tax=Kribbella turkmenica TaxID=2530375 RepID=A0A4R4X9N6_9ACTN|nr:superoxide dismutase [Kribbella turkmenica]TDD27172.1 superoxide dismutase [Kribbella turkmenica]
MFIRSVTALLGLAALILGLTTAPATAATSSGSTGKHAFPTRIALPDGFRPEGIAIKGGTAYLGSLADGDIYAVSLRTGKGKVISQGPGTPSVGLKIDRRGRLFVAGGPAGTARVVDSRTGRILANYQLAPGAPTFVNDVVLGRHAAYFTDSQRPVIYKVPFGRHGKLLGQSAVRTIPLTGDYEHQTGFNVNGITLTPDRRALIIVQSSTGLLFRVNPWTGVTRRVDLAVPMTNGDGLLTIGRRLYVVQNQLNKIAVVKLNRAGTSGSLVREITSPDFDVPTTVATFGKRLYLPNARFNVQPPLPTTPYWVTAVRR